MIRVKFCPLYLYVSSESETENECYSVFTQPYMINLKGHILSYVDWVSSFKQITNIKYDKHWR